MTNPYNQFFTPDLEKRLGGEPKELLAKIVGQWKRLPKPKDCANFRNDKDLFCLTFDGIKIFVAANDVGGLTIMLPEEYRHG